ncbi:MAG: hypothetical protein AB7L09_21380 [Nitrospira sp.]
MQFKLPQSHPLSKNLFHPGWFWSLSNSYTRNMLREAFCGEPSHVIERQVKNEKTGKLERKKFFIRNSRNDEARDYCNQFFELFAHFLGVTKSQVIHSFLTCNQRALQSCWGASKRRSDTPPALFVEIAQEAWDKAEAAMRDWKPSYQGMAIFMDARYASIAKERRITPEEAKRAYEVAYKRSVQILGEKSVAKIEMCVAHAHAQAAVRRESRLYGTEA